MLLSVAILFLRIQRNSFHFLTSFCLLKINLKTWLRLYLALISLILMEVVNKLVYKVSFLHLLISFSLENKGVLFFVSLLSKPERSLPHTCVAMKSYADIFVQIFFFCTNNFGRLTWTWKQSYSSIGRY